MLKQVIVTGSKGVVNWMALGLLIYAEWASSRKPICGFSRTNHPYTTEDKAHYALFAHDKEANLNIQQVLAIFELVQLQLKLEDALLADWQVVLMAARADRLHVMHQVILIHQLC